MEFYLLSCEKAANGGGIYLYGERDGSFVKLKYLPCDFPMYAVKDGETLHIIKKYLIGESGDGGYFTASADLSTATKPVSTLGNCPCHLCVDGKDNYIVNYLSGNIVKNCISAVKHSGIGFSRGRQDEPHTHFSEFSPDEKYVLCCDLGLDSLFVYDRDLRQTSVAKVPDGYGIRHFVFSADEKFIYAINELVSSVSVFEYESGKVKYKKTVDLSNKVGGAAIRLSKNGKNAFCSVRFENLIYSLSVDGDNLKVVQKIDSCGDSPRDIFILDDKYLVSCNEKSGNAIIFGVKDNHITEKVQEIECGGVLCCLKK